MNVIYEPKGRAREYSSLACNLYSGCTHGCKYCYAPACMRTTSEKWHQVAIPRKNIIARFEKDAIKLAGDRRPILFCFLTDPYQPIEWKERLTRQALEIVHHQGLKSQILTKGSFDIISEDLDLMAKAGTELGLTVTFLDDAIRKRWEPFASPIQDRLRTLKAASGKGIFTWVSLEPVIDPDQALNLIREASPYVQFWKIGKLNHMKSEEAKVDWAKFLSEVEALLKFLGSKYYIKNDLKAFETVDPKTY
jgi:DNA repair photolyase